jgi:hypothetical protein
MYCRRVLQADRTVTGTVYVHVRGFPAHEARLQTR